MKVKIIENFYFMSILYKMGTIADIDEKYHPHLQGKIEPIKVVKKAAKPKKKRGD